MKGVLRNRSSWHAKPRRQSIKVLAAENMHPTIHQLSQKTP